MQGNTSELAGSALAELGVQELSRGLEGQAFAKVAALYNTGTLRDGGVQAVSVANTVHHATPLLACGRVNEFA